MDIEKKLCTNKISSASFRKAVILSILITVGYGIFTILFRNNSNITVLINDSLVPIINITTLIIVFFAFRQSKNYERDYYYAWLVLLISQAFWVLGDLLWLTWNYDLTDQSILTYSYISFTLKTVFFCLGLYLIPKPYMDILDRYKRMIEIITVLVTFTIIFWSFLIIPFTKITPIDAFDYTVLVLNILSVFVLMFFVLNLFASHTGNLRKGPVPYILASATFQVAAVMVYAYEYLLDLYPAGGIENVFWVSAILSMALAALVHIRCPPPRVLEDLSTDYWRFKIPFETNLTLLLGGVAYLVVLWAYYNDRAIFDVLLVSAGFLVGLGIVRSAINNREIRKSYKKLKLSKQTYQSVLNTINDAVYIIDPNANLLEVNRGALDMYGYTKREIIGESFEMLSAPGKNDIEKVAAAGLRALNGEDQTFEFWGMRKNGEIFPKEIKLNKGTYFGQDVVVAVARDITLRKEYEKSLKRSLDEKEAMVQEIHHRVKNNMQVVSSLLGLQSMYLEDDKVQNALKESQNRVQSMAMIHEKLYKSDNLSSVDMDDYLYQITHHLLKNYQLESNKIKTNIKAEKVEMDIKIASPLGLIINELITNSLKYAFPEGEGEITLKICLVDGCYHLTIADDGVGLPDDFSLNKTETLGLQLVNRLVQQISGSIELCEDSKGTEFIIKFPA